MTNFKVSNLVPHALALASCLVAGAALASNYPPGYCDQNVRVLQDGPALFAHAGSGCEGLEIVGYKNNGILAASHPDHIDVIVTAGCSQNSSWITRTTTIRLGQEWHGQGYLSEAHSYYSYLPSGCWEGDAKVSYAFSANGQWDSKFGANYTHANGPGFYGEDPSRVSTLETHQAGYGSVNLTAWDFIVSKLGE